MRPVRRADNLTTFVCRLSSSLGASTYWSPQGLSRTVMGLFLPSQNDFSGCFECLRAGKELHVASGRNYLEGGNMYVQKFFNKASFWNSFFPSMPPHVLMYFRGFPPGCGDSVGDFWRWYAHGARLRCPDDVSGDMQEDEIPGGALSLNLLTTQTMVTTGIFSCKEKFPW